MSALTQWRHHNAIFSHFFKDWCCRRSPSCLLDIMFDVKDFWTRTFNERSSKIPSCFFKECARRKEEQEFKKKSLRPLCEVWLCRSGLDINKRAEMQRAQFTAWARRSLAAKRPANTPQYPWCCATGVTLIRLDKGGVCSRTTIQDANRAMKLWNYK